MRLALLLTVTIFSFSIEASALDAAPSNDASTPPVAHGHVSPGQILNADPLPPATGHTSTISDTPNQQGHTSRTAPGEDFDKECITEDPKTGERRASWGGGNANCINSGSKSGAGNSATVSGEVSNLVGQSYELRYQGLTLEQLKARREALFTAFTSIIASGHTPDSVPARNLANEIKWLDEKVVSLGGNVPVASATQPQPPTTNTDEAPVETPYVQPASGFGSKICIDATAAMNNYCGDSTFTSACHEAVARKESVCDGKTLNTNVNPDPLPTPAITTIETPPQAIPGTVQPIPGTVQPNDLCKQNYEYLTKYCSGDLNGAQHERCDPVKRAYEAGC